jgi:hypothetical protein
VILPKNIHLSLTAYLACDDRQEKVHINKTSIIQLSSDCVLAGPEFCIPKIPSRYTNISVKFAIKEDTENAFKLLGKTTINHDKLFNLTYLQKNENDLQTLKTNTKELGELNNKYGKQVNAIFIGASTSAAGAAFII